MALLNEYGEKKATFYLKVDVPAIYNNGTHPLGNVRMNTKIAIMIRPILECQPWVDKVLIVKTNPACKLINLDTFRDVLNYPLSMGNISHWYYPTSFDLFTPPNLHEPWLEGISKTRLPGKDIVLFRSSRYRIQNLDYGILRKYASRIAFLGVDAEHIDFQEKFFKVDKIEIKDFKHAASIIAGARLVIGNQTGLFSLAEALKANRLLETSPVCPNVIMAGGNFQYIISSYQFTNIFKTFVKKLGLN
jgi:hypothetical protein